MIILDKQPIADTYHGLLLCVFLYLRHSESQNIHSMNKVRIVFGSEDILAGSTSRDCFEALRCWEKYYNNGSCHKGKSTRTCLRILKPCHSLLSSGNLTDHATLAGDHPCCRDCSPELVWPNQHGDKR